MHSGGESVGTGVMVASPERKQPACVSSHGRLYQLLVAPQVPKLWVGESTHSVSRTPVPRAIDAP